MKKIPALSRCGNEYPPELKGTVGKFVICLHLSDFDVTELSHRITVWFQGERQSNLGEKAPVSSLALAIMRVISIGLSAVLTLGLTDNIQ